MPTLGIDIETYSEVDLPKCGVYAYAEHPHRLTPFLPPIHGR